MRLKTLCTGSSLNAGQWGDPRSLPAVTGRRPSVARSALPTATAACLGRPSRSWPLSSPACTFRSSSYLLRANFRLSSARPATSSVASRRPTATCRGFLQEMPRVPCTFRWLPLAKAACPERSRGASTLTSPLSPLSARRAAGFLQEISRAPCTSPLPPAAAVPTLRLPCPAKSASDGRSRIDSSLHAQRGSRARPWKEAGGGLVRRRR
jgi:hypothetical protein